MSNKHKKVSHVRIADGASITRGYAVLTLFQLYDPGFKSMAMLGPKWLAPVCTYRKLDVLYFSCIDTRARTQHALAFKICCIQIYDLALTWLQKPGEDYSIYAVYPGPSGT